MDTLNIGMIGLDTSHCEAFTNIINDEQSPYHVGGAKIIGAFPGGSQLCACSRDRVDSITQRMRDEKGIRIFDSIEELADGMDAFFLESVDGRQHLEQFKILAQFGKPVFIDKPLACCYSDAKAIAELAKEKNVPIMTASAIRYATGSSNLCDEGASVMACEAFGPMQLPNDYPKYFWYGIHSADTLYSYMGKGCKTVKAIHLDDTDLLIGEWDDGRIGSIRGTRFEGTGFGCTVFTDKGIKHGLSLGDPPYYANMMKQIIPFFQTGQSPIELEESLEIIGFLDAATKSRENNGQTVTIESL